MNRGRLLSTFVAALGYSSANIQACLDRLRSNVHRAVGAEMFRGIALDGREYLAFDALIDLGVIRPQENTETGHVIIDHLDRFARDAQLVAEVLITVAGNEPRLKSQIELAWTIPFSLSQLIDLEPPSRSLAGLLRHTISQAQHRLIMVSPFLEQQGLEQLEMALKGAMDRGVELLLISQSTEQNLAWQKAYDYLQRTLPRIQCFCPVPSRQGDRYMLIHAKVIVADESYAALSSANFTQYGLTTHLEIGIGLGGETAAYLATLFMRVIESGFVEPI